MNAEIEKLLETIVSDKSYDEREIAALQLVTIIEKVYTTATHQRIPYWALPPILDTIFLSPEEEKELIERILETAHKNLDNSLLGTLLWMVGKARGDAAIPVLPIFLLLNYQNVNNSALYQGLISLENYLGDDAFRRIDSKRLKEIKTMYTEIAAFFDPLPAEIAKRDLEWLEKTFP